MNTSRLLFKYALLCLLASSLLVSCSKREALQREAEVVRAELDLKRAELKDIEVQLRAITTTQLPKATRKPPTQEEVGKAKAEVKKLLDEKGEIEGVVNRLQKTLDDAKSTLAIAMESPAPDSPTGATPIPPAQQ